MFVWLFHRLSGVVLLVLLGLQLLTGLAQSDASAAKPWKTLALLHRHPVVNCVLAACVIFHGLYGVRTIVLDLGVKRERLLFWVCTGIGAVAFVAFLFLYFGRGTA